MLEPWRSHYLRAIGVEVYLPRYDLPAAGISTVASWDALAAMPEVDMTPPMLVASPARAAEISLTKSPISSIPHFSETEKVVRQVQQAEVSVRASISKEAATQIHLYIACDGDGILIIDDIPAPPRREYVQRLIVNLLFAAERKSVRLSAEQFDWPLHSLRNRQVTLDEQAGRETIDGFLSRKIQADRIHTIYLLGDSASHWISPDQRQALSVDRPLRWKTSISAEVVLGDAQLKRRWWKDLCGSTKQ